MARAAGGGSSLASSATLPRAPGDISMVLSTGCGPGPQKLGSEAEVSLVSLLASPLCLR